MASTEYYQKLAERIENLRVEKGLSVLKLANIMGLHSGNLAKFLRGNEGRNTVNLLAVRKLCEYYEISPEEFLNIEQGYGKTAYKYVSFYDIQASAGGGIPAPNSEEQRISVHQDLLNKLSYSNTDLNVVKVSGDSMYPTLRDGDFIFVKKNFDGHITQRIYLLNDMWGNLKVKRLSWAPDGDLLVISDNKEYETEKYTRTDLENGNIRIIGQVVGVLSMKPL